MKKGDIVTVGNHRIMCGDATNPDDVKELMQDIKSPLLFTSPPYSNLRKYGGNLDLDVSHLAQFIPAWKNYVEYIAVNVGLIRREYEIVQWWNPYLETAKLNNLKLLCWNVWDKKSTGNIGYQTSLIPRHEFIFVFGDHYRELNKTWDKVPENIKDHVRISSRRQNDDSVKKEAKRYLNNPLKVMESIVSINSEKGPIRSEHPAVFPVGLPEEYIKTFTNQNDVVVDCFGGSGTTLIAAQRQNRRGAYMDLNPEYCEVAIKRIKSEVEK